MPLLESGSYTEYSMECGSRTPLNKETGHRARDCHRILWLLVQQEVNIIPSSPNNFIVASFMNCPPAPLRLESTKGTSVSAARPTVGPYHADVVPIQQDFRRLDLGPCIITAMASTKDQCDKTAILAGIPAYNSVTSSITMSKAH